MRVVFMGTPDFAVATLEAIYQSEHEVVGVVTAPDKPAGRGLKLQSSEVKKYALEKELPLLQPQKLKEPEFIEALKQWRADLFVVVAFRMLPAEVYSLPPKGAFNVHASFLPQYRGAAPIHWAIMNGETHTGISTFFLNNEIDCGDIILQRKIDILPNENTGELYNRLKELGAEVAIETLTQIEKGKVDLQSQDNIEKTTLKLAPKIHKEDTIIDWNCSAEKIGNKIRGLSPYPGALTFFTNKDGKKVSVKIFDAIKTDDFSTEEVGKIVTDDKTFLYILTKDFKISVLNLQIEGKNRQNVFSFLQGNKISNYTIHIN
jgi:methionyl-tRNA formyltransferase